MVVGAGGGGGGGGGGVVGSPCKEHGMGAWALNSNIFSVLVLYTDLTSLLLKYASSCTYKVTKCAIYSAYQLDDILRGIILSVIVKALKGHLRHVHFFYRNSSL